MTTRRELTTTVGQRYQAADRIAKKLILDECTKITGYHRKHAIRVLTAQPAPTRERPLVLWEAADRICGKAAEASAAAVAGRP